MIKFQDLKIGNIVLAEFEGQQREGTVIGLDKEDKEVSVQTEVQDFWFTPDHLFPITLNENQLIKFGFEKVANADGSVKYMKDAFRLLFADKDNFSSIEMWYREDRRHFNHSLFVHELQNLFHDMTKIDLTR